MEGTIVPSDVDSSSESSTSVSLLGRNIDQLTMASKGYDSESSEEEKASDEKDMKVDFSASTIDQFLKRNMLNLDGQGTPGIEFNDEENGDQHRETQFKKDQAMKYNELSHSSSSSFSMASQSGKMNKGQENTPLHEQAEADDSVLKWSPSEINHSHKMGDSHYRKIQFDVNSEDEQETSLHNISNTSKELFPSSINTSSFLSEKENPHEHSNASSLFSLRSFGISSTPGSDSNISVPPKTSKTKIMKKPTVEKGWNHLNNRLQECGCRTFASIPMSEAVANASGAIFPDQLSLFESVLELIQKYEERGDTIQDMALGASSSASQLQRGASSARGESKKMKSTEKALARCKNELRHVEEQLETQQQKSKSVAKQLEQDRLNLKQQLAVSERRVRAKERLVTKIQDRLEAQIQKEKRANERDRVRFHELHGRDCSSAKSSDSKTLEVIRMYEIQREDMTLELQHLKTELRKANAELSYQENRATDFCQVKSGHWTSSDTNDENIQKVPVQNVPVQNALLDRMEAARREQEDATEKLRVRESQIRQKCTRLEAHYATANVQIQELEERLANCEMELSSRPSISAYRLVKKKLAQAERQIVQHQEALASASDVAELRTFMDTKELMSRDRLNHALHLNRLESLPKDTLLSVIQEICRALNITDVSQILPSLVKMCHVITAVPRMEAFIHDICEVVSQRRRQRGQSPQKNVEALEDVIPTLEKWQRELCELESLREFHAQVGAELNARVCTRLREPDTPAEEQPALAKRRHGPMSDHQVHVLLRNYFYIYSDIFRYLYIQIYCTCLYVHIHVCSDIRSNPRSVLDRPWPIFQSSLKWSADG